MWIFHEAIPHYRNLEKSAKEVFILEGKKQSNRVPQLFCNEARAKDTSLIYRHHGLYHFSLPYAYLSNHSKLNTGLLKLFVTSLRASPDVLTTLTFICLLLIKIIV